MILILFFLININFISLCQESFFRCITPEINKQALKLNPNAQKAKKLLDQYIKNYKSKTDTLIIIPVVFHIVHNYGPENISKEQILDGLRILNEGFRKKNYDTLEIIPPFKGIAADCKIEFRLAKIDPNGNCTDGIVRIQSEMTYNASENIKQIAPIWDRSKYLNIWVVASIESGAAGYAYYPTSVDGPWGEDKDGVVILSSYVGSIGTGDYTRSKALIHEVGHYLNLIHTWGNNNDPGLPENCYDDDEVEDTPNTIGHYGCSNLYEETCNSLDNIQNYMEYSYCHKMFTLGQKERMRAVLHSSIANRNNLWTYENLLATGVADNFEPPICQPIADFTYDKTVGCDSLTVNFINHTWNTDTISQYIWHFPGGTPETSNAINPTVKYNSPGIFSASLTAINPAGSNTKTKDSIIHVMNTSIGYYLPFIESFEDPSFPLINDNMFWEIKSNALYKWLRTDIASHSGTYSLIAPLNYMGLDKYTELISPLIIFNVTPNSTLTFYYAYAQRNQNSNDNLKVYISKNCGETWYLRFNKSGSNLQTTNGLYIPNFIPSNDQWQKVDLPLGFFSSSSQIRIKFVATSSGPFASNPIYIDDINIYPLKSSKMEDTYSDSIFMFPNPFSEQTELTIYSEIYKVYNLQIYNILGDKVYERDLYLNEGLNNIKLNLKFLNPGVYILSIKDSKNGKNFILKAIKN